MFLLLQSDNFQQQDEVENKLSVASNFYHCVVLLHSLTLSEAATFAPDAIRISTTEI